MSDRRTVKLVITAISDGDNFETAEKDNEALTEVMEIVVGDETTLYQILQRCKKIAIGVEEE